MTCCCRRSADHSSAKRGIRMPSGCDDCGINGRGPIFEQERMHTEGALKAERNISSNVSRELKYVWRSNC